MSHKAHCLLTQSLNKYLKTTKECKHVVTIKPFQMISEKLDPSHPHYKCLWNCYHLSVHHSIAIILNVRTKHKFCFQIDKKHSALNKWIYVPQQAWTQYSTVNKGVIKHKNLLSTENYCFAKTGDQGDQEWVGSLQSGPSFMALLTVSTKSTLTKAGNSVRPASIFHGLAENICFCACLLNITRHSMLTRLSQKFGACM